MAARPETKVLAQTKKSAPRDLVGYPLIRNEIVNLLQSVRQAAARTVNALMTVTYWEIGRRIVEAEQKGKRRADYGEQLIERLAKDPYSHLLAVGLGWLTLPKCAVFTCSGHSKQFFRRCLKNLLLKFFRHRLYFPWAAPALYP